MNELSGDNSLLYFESARLPGCPMANRKVEVWNACFTALAGAEAGSFYFYQVLLLGKTIN